jgi:hypothetical protein
MERLLTRILLDGIPTVNVSQPRQVDETSGN